MYLGLFGLAIILTAVGVFFFWRAIKKEKLNITDEERSKKFQAHIQEKLFELRNLHFEGAEAETRNKLIKKFEAAGKFDLANLFLKNLILNTSNITDEKVRGEQHQQLLQLVKEISVLHEEGAIETDIAKSFLSLADQQFKNEMKRLAGKIQVRP